MAINVNSRNQSLPVSRTPLPVKKDWAWSKSDSFKHMIYSALSWFGSSWATTNLQILKAMHCGNIDPNIDPVAAKASVVRALSRLRVFEARKTTLAGLSMIKQFAEEFKMPKDDVIQYLSQNDALWPQGQPTLNDLASHVFHVVYVNGKADWKATQPYTDGLVGFKAAARKALEAFTKFSPIFSQIPKPGPLTRYKPLNSQVIYVRNN